jgi:TolB-like protein
MEPETCSSDIGAAARVELERMLADDRFRSPPRRRKMLRFIVEETVAGRGDALTAVPIAQTVFGRDETFDHQTDPVVRIEAHQLRNDIANYYIDAGRNNPFRIFIPKGHYAAHFERGPQLRKEPDSGSGSAVSQVPFWWGLSAVIGIAMLLMGIGLGYLWLRSEASERVAEAGPVVLVEPFSPGEQTDINMAEGIAHEVVTALMRFPNIKVKEYQTLHSAGSTSFGPQLDSESLYALTGSITLEPTEFLINARLVRTEDKTVVWSGKYTGELTVKKLLTIRTEVAGDIASKLGQSFGAINDDQSKKMDLFQPRLSGYECILRAYHYRNNAPGETLYRPVKACLQRTVADEPEYAEAWAMLSILYNDDIRFSRVSGEQIEQTRAGAITAAARALALDPDNMLGAIAISAIDFYQGNYERAEKYSRLAVKNNPNDPMTLGALGFRLVLRGKFAEGTSYMEQAIARSVTPPGWFYAVIAIDRLMAGDGKGMLEAAERSTIEGSALSQSLVVMAYGLLGDNAGANLAIERMNKLTPRYDPIARFSAHQANDEILEAMKHALRRAGWYQENQAALK